MSTDNAGDGLREAVEALTRRVGTIEPHVSDAAAVTVNTGDLRLVLRHLAESP